MAITFDRKEKLIEDILKTMDMRDSEELKNIYSDNDVNKYSDETFEAISRILKQRGERLPFRDITKKRVHKPVRPGTIFGVGWRGFLLAFFAWVPILLYLSYNFGLELIIYAKLIHKGIGAVAFLISAMFAEKLICRVKGII